MSDLLKDLGKSLGSVAHLLSGGGLIDGIGGALGLPPVITNVVKTVAGAVTGNVLMAADGAIGLAQELSKNPPAATEYHAPKDDKAACDGYAKPPSRTHTSSPVPTSGPVPNDSHLDPKLGQYLDALKTLDQNFGYLDATDGKMDGTLSLADLKRISGDSRVSPELRSAARFLVDNPGYFEKLDNGASLMSPLGDKRGVGNDDRISQGNLALEILSVQSDIARYGQPRSASSSAPSTSVPGSGSTGSTSASGPVSSSTSSSGSTASSSMKNIINDPSMSLEEKINAILENLTEKMDDEILGTMDALAAAQDKKAGISNEQGNEKALTDAQRDIDRISMRLQQLVEKRKTMFEMMSTMSMKFDEMAKTALSNMRSA